jgi:hypothetical protein
MTETQRQPVPRGDGGELDTATAFLTFARNCVLKKADGLTDEQLRRVLVGSGTSILGLIQHLTVGERYWFGFHLLGSGSEGDPERDEDWDFGMEVPAERGSEQVLADYRAAIAASDAAIRSVGDPAALCARPVDGKLLSLRWALAHATSETAACRTCRHPAGATRRRDRPLSRPRTGPCARMEECAGVTSTFLHPLVL